MPRTQKPINNSVHVTSNVSEYRSINAGKVPFPVDFTWQNTTTTGK